MIRILSKLSREGRTTLVKILIVNNVGLLIVACLFSCIYAENNGILALPEFLSAFVDFPLFFPPLVVYSFLSSSMFLVKIASSILFRRTNKKIKYRDFINNSAFLFLIGLGISIFYISSWGPYSISLLLFLMSRLHGFDVVFNYIKMEEKKLKQ